MAKYIDWRNIASVLLAFALLIASSRVMCAPSGGDATTSASDDPVAREIVLVFDPRRSPPSASDLVDGRADTLAARPYFALLARAESFRQWFRSPFLNDSQLQDIRSRDPVAPEVLINEVIVARYPSGSDMGASLKLLLSDPEYLTQ